MRAYARRGDLLVRRELFVGRNHDVEIGDFALVAGAGDQLERRDRREQTIVAEAIQVVGGLGVSAREIYHDVGIDQVCHREPRTVKTGVPAGGSRT